MSHVQSKDVTTSPCMSAIRVDAFLREPRFTSSLRPSHDTPRPRPSKTNPFLIRVTHTSLQQVDLLYAQGLHQNNNLRKGHVHPPFTLGLDFAGEIIDIHPDFRARSTHNDENDATNGLSGRTTSSSSDRGIFHVGQRVMGSSLGAFAEYIVTRPESIVPIPSNTSSKDAATLVGGAVSYGAVVNAAHVQAGQTVLVSGVPGGLAVIACQIARANGAAKVIALCKSHSRAETLLRWDGLDAEIVASTSNWTAEVMRLTAGKGVDVIIDNVGIVEDGLKGLSYGGRIVLVGFAGRDGVMERIAMNKVLLKGAKIMGYVSHV